MSCPYHHNLCAYTGIEGDRCPCCHSLWQVILACTGLHACGRRSKSRRRAGLPPTQEYHLAVHEQARTRRAAKPEETEEPEEPEEP